MTKDKNIFLKFVGPVTKALSEQVDLSYADKHDVKTILSVESSQDNSCAIALMYWDSDGRSRNWEVEKIDWHENDDFALKKIAIDMLKSRLKVNSEYRLKIILQNGEVYYLLAEPTEIRIMDVRVELERVD